ncbi:unnamed protein product, partial [Allacma fusca]
MLLFMKPILEPLFDNKLKHLKKKTKSENWNVLEILTWEKSEIRLTKFELKVENCLWKLQWAVDFLEMINTPLRVLKDEKSSVLTPKTDSKFGYRLENHFKEGIYNCYSREMFEYWGVNGFVKCFGSSIYRKTDLCFYQFQSYLGNLLNVWSTPGNLDKFIMSPDFWNTFLDIAKFILESSKFVGVWEAPLITEYSSLVSENSYFTWVHQLETNSQYLNDFANSRFFGYYLGNLLKVWDTRENMDEFVTSPSFLNRFMDLGKN